jgi:predicted 3-demethylubiquinone-9 3-methyltransferase (glyoxalase superfamily)
MEEAAMQAHRITTFLTVSERGEEAVKFYVSLFRSSRIHALVRWEDDGPVPRGALMHARFELDGEQFMAMDAGPHFKFEQGFSLFVSCETQEEIDRLWARLSEGGEPQQCGWLKDRWGVSWQIVPSIMGELMGDAKSAASQRVMEAMLKMTKLDIGALKKAHEG